MTDERRPFERFGVDPSERLRVVLSRYALWLPVYIISFLIGLVAIGGTSGMGELLAFFPLIVALSPMTWFAVVVVGPLAAYLLNHRAVIVTGVVAGLVQAALLWW